MKILIYLRHHGSFTFDNIHVFLKDISCFRSDVGCMFNFNQASAATFSLLSGI